MVDIVLLLIIFFMLTAQFSQSMLRAMDIPREKGAQTAESRSHQTTIDLDRDGSLRLNNEPLSSDRLLQKLSSDIKATGPVDVILRADRRCDSVHLNRLAAGLTAVGVRDWRLATSGEGAP
jgi:biopolymer transport protein ExbD